MEKYILVAVGAVAAFVCSTSALFRESTPTRYIRLDNPEETMNITSPNYPGKYNNRADILWRVIAPSGYRVLLHFTLDFKTEENHDYVTVYDGRKLNLNDAMHRINTSGFTRPRNITSIGSYLWLRFTTDVDGTNTGFKAIVSCVRIRDISLTSGKTSNISSPNFPNPYDNNADILWKVTAPAGYRVLLHFTHFSVEPDRDYVTVYEGRASDFGEAVQRVNESGRAVPSNITSIGSYLWLRFVSDGSSPSVIHNGFNAELLSVEIPVIDLTVEDTAHIASPNFPNQYDNNIDILWKVTTPSGCRAVVRFLVFNTESGYDNVTVFEGRSPDFEESIERVRLSGNPRLRSYTSVGSYLWLRFTSDLFNFNTSHPEKGFSALLSCGTLIDIPLENTKAAEVTSPNYPDPYDNHADVLWRVTAPDGYRVGLHFAEFDTEPGYDFVTVYEGRMPSIEMSVKRIHVSGYSSLHNITSIGSFLWIRFTSDRKNEHNTSISLSPHTGFKAVLSSIPIRALSLTTAKPTPLASPKYPQPYDSNIDILWKVIAPSSYRVTVSFSAFNTMLESDFVTVYEGMVDDFEQAVERIKLHGPTLPDNVTSIGSYVWLRFTSGNEINSCSSCSGFKALLGVISVTEDESQSPTSFVINGRSPPPKTNRKEDTLNSVEILSIAVSLSLLLIGLILLALFIYCRRRSKNSKTADSTSPDDDAVDSVTLHRNPIYGVDSNDITGAIKNTIGIAGTEFDTVDSTYCSIDDVPSGDKPTAVLDSGLPSIYEECAEGDILDHKPLAGKAPCHVAASEGTISCVREKVPSEIHQAGLTDDGYRECIPASKKTMPAPFAETAEGTISCVREKVPSETRQAGLIEDGYEECISASNKTIPAPAAETTEGTISCVRENVPSETRQAGLTEDGYEECIPASNKARPTPSAETAEVLSDESKSGSSPTRLYFAIGEDSKHDVNYEHNDFKSYADIPPQGWPKAENPLHHVALSHVKTDDQYLGFDEQNCRNPHSGANTATLCHDKEYDLLDFNKSGPTIRSISKSQSTLSRHGSTENLDDEQEATSYGVLNVLKNMDPCSPPNIIHDDNVYNILSGAEFN